MSGKTKYNTLNRNYFLQIVQTFHQPFTAKDVAQKLQYNENPMGTSTIYRFLDEFTSDGTLRKTLGNDNMAHYFYFKQCDNENHFYLECEKCHTLFHLDCKHLRSFSKHLAKKHSFQISNYSLIITGICDNCAKDN